MTNGAQVFRLGVTVVKNGNLPLTSWKLCIARAHCLRWFWHWPRRAASRAACTAGKSSATSTPMIAITTSNSTSVKPDRLSRKLEEGLIVSFPGIVLDNDAIANPAPQFTQLAAAAPGLLSG